MKQAITSGVFAISFVSLLVLGLVSWVQARACSNASIKGTYGFSCEGTLVGVGPLAAIGVFTAFAMAGFGMAKYHRTHREDNWRRRFVINFSAGVLTAIVVVVFAVTDTLPSVVQCIV